MSLNSPENNIVLPTYDIISKELRNADKMWCIRHQALLDKIISQDGANQLRFEGFNKIKETQTELLNRCATKDETRLAITEKVTELEIKIKDAQLSLRDAIAVNVTVLETKNAAESRRIDTHEVYLKVIIGGFLLAIFAGLISRYIGL
jgi:hypothetical protein